MKKQILDDETKSATESAIESTNEAWINYKKQKQDEWISTREKKKFEKKCNKYNAACLIKHDRLSVFTDENSNIAEYESSALRKLQTQLHN